MAAAQDGAISAAQLAGAGLSRRAVQHRLKTGVLTRRHRGVYLLGAVEGPYFAEHAAVLVCGPHAVLSDDTGLALHELIEKPEIVHITRPTTGHAPEGVRVHRRERPNDVRYRHGLPVTSPADTLKHVASSMPKFELARLVEEAEVRRLVTRARERLIVEIDGFAFHGGRAAFERDRRRDARLLALGYRVLRITWRQLTREPHAVVATISAALAAATPARAG